MAKVHLKTGVGTGKGVEQAENKPTVTKNAPVTETENRGWKPKQTVARGNGPSHLTHVPEQQHVLIPQRDPISGGGEVRHVSRVAERLSMPTGPGGITPREFANLLDFDTHHHKAVAKVGDMAVIERLKTAGTDVPMAETWRNFFWDVARISAERSPNPSAAGRAVLMDWVVFALGGKSVGIETLNGWVKSDPRIAHWAENLGKHIVENGGDPAAVKAWLGEQ